MLNLFGVYNLHVKYILNLKKIKIPKKKLKILINKLFFDNLI